MMQELCPKCGKPYEVHENYCKQCGTVRPSRAALEECVTLALTGDSSAIDSLCQMTHDIFEQIAEEVIGSRGTDEEKEQVVEDAYTEMFEQLPTLTDRAGFEEWGSNIMRTKASWFVNRPGYLSQNSAQYIPGAEEFPDDGKSGGKKLAKGDGQKKSPVPIIVLVVALVAVLGIGGFIGVRALNPPSDDLQPEEIVIETESESEAV